jgi:ankyrin repeat protein
VDIINKLCGTSADLNARNRDNATPLQIAAENQVMTMGVTINI